VWVAQELLAARAAGAAERRQRAVLAACPPATAAAMPSAADFGAAAARAVKQVWSAEAQPAGHQPFELSQLFWYSVGSVNLVASKADDSGIFPWIQAAQAASASASEATASAAQAAAVAAAFPQLPGGQHSAGTASTAEAGEAAFSDDEAPDPGEAQLSGVPPKVEAPPNSFSSDGAASALAGLRQQTSQSHSMSFHVVLCICSDQQ
jgi:hypothetical protein